MKYKNLPPIIRYFLRIAYPSVVFKDADMKKIKQLEDWSVALILETLKKDTSRIYGGLAASRLITFIELVEEEFELHGKFYEIFCADLRMLIEKELVSYVHTKECNL